LGTSQLERGHYEGHEGSGQHPLTSTHVIALVLFTISGLYTTIQRSLAVEVVAKGLGLSLLLAIVVLVLYTLGTAHAAKRDYPDESSKSRLSTGPKTVPIAREIIGPAALVIAIAAISTEDWNNPLTSLHYWPLITEIFGSNWRTGDKLLGVLSLFALLFAYIGFKFSLSFAVSHCVFRSLTSK